MKKVFLFLLSLLSLGGCTDGPVTVDNTTVKQLDLKQFMGRWYEIARYDHKFERGMTNVTATYTLLDNGRIEVVNEGLKDGKRKTANGKGKLPDASQPGKLKVSFFLWFYADYYVLDIVPDYSYVLVGSSSDKYLWIMSRTKALPQSALTGILGNLRRRGYDTAKLIWVKQEGIIDNRKL